MRQQLQRVLRGDQLELLHQVNLAGEKANGRVRLAQLMPAVAEEEEDAEEESKARAVDAGGG